MSSKKTEARYPPVNFGETEVVVGHFEGCSPVHRDSKLDGVLVHTSQLVRDIDRYLLGIIVGCALIRRAGIGEVQDHLPRRPRLPCHYPK